MDLPDGEFSALKHATASVAVLGRLVDDLVEGWEHVVSELQLCDGRGAGDGGADSETGDTLLTQRRVEDAVGAELVLEAERAAEHTAEGNVLAEDDGRVVLVQGRVQRLVDRLEHVQLGRLAAHGRFAGVRLVGEVHRSSLGGGRHLRTLQQRPGHHDLRSARRKSGHFS